MKTFKRTVSALVLAFCATTGLAGCSQAPQTESAMPINKDAGLHKVNIGQMKPVHLHGNIYLAGQPSTDDLKLLKDKGVKTIVCIRHADEIDWDQAAAVEAEGMNYLHVPFQGQDELTTGVFDELLGALRDSEAKEEPLVLHCGSANRVGAIWYAHRRADDGLSHDEALAEAKTVGLRNEAYIEKAAAYVEEQQDAGPAANP